MYEERQQNHDLNVSLLTGADRREKEVTSSAWIAFIMKLLIASICCFYISSSNGLKLPSHLSFSPKRCLISVKESFGRSRLFSSATPTEEQKKSGLGWDSHQAISDIPESLVRTIDGNDSMRRKFEALCRTAQVCQIDAKFHNQLAAVANLKEPLTYSAPNSLNFHCRRSVFVTPLRN